MRELTPEECEFIAGGLKDRNVIASTTPEYTPPPPIVVTASPPPPPPYYPPPPPPPYLPPPPSGGGGGGGGGGSNPGFAAPDTASNVNEVKINLTRALTADEQDDVNQLKKSIADARAVINALPDNARLTLPDGSIITGQELKAAWAKADFVINEHNFDYGGGNRNGQADWNGGDPIIRINLNIVDGYNDLGKAGINFLPLHELGHLAAASRLHNETIYADDTVTAAERAQHERMANDIARAIAAHPAVDMPILANPEHGYSTTAPLTFK